MFFCFFLIKLFAVHSWLLTTGLTFYEHIKKKYFIFLDIRPYSKGLWKNIKQRLFEDIPSSRLNLINETIKNDNALISDNDINIENNDKINNENIFLEGNFQVDKQKGKKYREFPASDDDNNENDNEENEDKKSDIENKDENSKEIKEDNDDNNNNEINNNYIQNKNAEETNSTKRTRKGGGVLIPILKKKNKEEQQNLEEEIDKNEIKIEKEKENDENSNSKNNLVETNRLEIKLEQNL